jgi:SAM-dependent methyltransferase
VDLVERSSPFVARLETLCRRDGLGTGQLWHTDLIDAPLPQDHYDLIFARWVFLFLPDPEAHLAKLVRALKPGGRLALQDYHRDTFALIPLPPEWSSFVAADRAFFASQGGDASIGARLPELYERVGLRVVETVPTIKTGRPGSPVWRWLSDYFLGVMERYAEFPPFDPAAAERLRQRWLASGAVRTSTLIAPTVLDVVGRKPPGGGGGR